MEHLAARSRAFGEERDQLVLEAVEDAGSWGMRSVEIEDTTGISLPAVKRAITRLKETGDVWQEGIKGVSTRPTSTPTRCERPSSRRRWRGRLPTTTDGRLGGSGGTACAVAGGIWSNASLSLTTSTTAPAWRRRRVTSSSCSTNRPGGTGSRPPRSLSRRRCRCRSGARLGWHRAAGRQLRRPIPRRLHCLRSATAWDLGAG